MASKSIASSPNYRWWAYSALAIGIFMGVMDQSGVAIALPRIAEHFGSDLPTVQWITLGYVLSISAMIMPMGRLSDMVGRKRVYMGGLAIFVGAAALGGSSNTLPLLVAAKIVQGVGAAAIQANGMAMITEVFPERERGKSLGLYMALIGAGAVSGPVVGGLLVSSLDWRAVFFAGVPVGTVALVASMVVLRPMASTDAEQTARPPTFDWLGAGLSSGALVSFLLAMTNAHRFGWDSAPIVAGFAVAFAMLAAFLWWQVRTGDPILDLGLFRRKGFTMGVAARFLSFLGGSAVFFIMPFYLIQVLDLPASRAGLVLVPSAIFMAIASPISGRLSDTIGTRWLTIAGLGLSAAAMFIFSTLSVDSSAMHVVVGMTLSGLGWGAFTSPNNNAILSAVEKQRYGVVVALLHLSRNSANVTGMALATTIVTFTMGASGYEPSLSAVAESSDGDIRRAFVTGMDRAFVVSGSLVILAMAVTWLRGESPAPTPAATERVSRP